MEKFVSLADSALMLAIEGVTSMDEVLRVAGEVDESVLLAEQDA